MKIFLPSDFGASDNIIEGNMIYGGMQEPIFYVRTKSANRLFARDAVVFTVGAIVGAVVIAAAVLV
jgi:hypothetical protein